MSANASNNDITVDESAGKAVIYHRMKESESIDDAAATIWSLLENAYESHPDHGLILALDIDGHRNSEGGFEVPVHTFLQHVCVRIISGLVDELILPHVRIETSDTDISTALKRDSEYAQKTDGERVMSDIDGPHDAELITTPEDVPEDLTAAEFVDRTTLVVQVEDDNTLRWEFRPDL